MSFTHVWYLLPALLMGALLVWIFTRLWNAKQRSDLVYSDVAFLQEAMKPSPLFQRVIAGVSLLAVLLLCTSLAGPHLVLPVPAKDVQIVLCIDTSGSMQSQDVSPDRAAAALAAARAFIERLPEGARVGIVSFSTGAEMIAPLTADHEAAIAALAQVPPPNGATAIGDALLLASQALGSKGHRAIVLITDGVNNHGADPDAVSQQLHDQHITVYTVGIGTNNGDIIPGTNEPATIDEDALQRYAQTTGGTYARAADAVQLRDALARLSGTTSFEVKRVDVTFGAALAGAALLVISILTYLGSGRIE